MHIRTLVAIACLAGLVGCKRPAGGGGATERAATAHPDPCGPSGPLVFRRAEMDGREGWVPVIHDGRRWYLEPRSSVCARHITRVTIDREAGHHFATVTFNGEGSRAMAQLTTVKDSYFAIAAFGEIQSVPRVEDRNDSGTVRIGISEHQLPAWQRVAKAIAGG